MRFTRRRLPPIRTLISETTVLRGDVRFTDGLRIDGQIHGDVLADDTSASMVVISENACVVGKIKAAHVIVWGSVSGEIVCDDLIEIHAKARLEGCVRYEVLEMHPGAVVNGELRAIKSNEKRTLTLAASNDA